MLDFEGNVSNLLNFLGLKWEKELINYQKTALARDIIYTPSYSQVVKPMYNTASFRWKYYEEYLRFNLGKLKPFSTEPKGELTIVISEKQSDKNTSQKISESDKKNIKIMINKLSTKEIANIISQKSKVSKKKIYEYCVKLKNEK